MNVSCLSNQKVAELQNCRSANLFGRIQYSDTFVIDNKGNGDSAGEDPSVLVCRNCHQSLMQTKSSVVS